METPEQPIQLPHYHEWSREFPQCQRCGTTDTPHKGCGLCSTCYHKEYRVKHPELIIKAQKRWGLKAKLIRRNQYGRQAQGN